MRIDTLPVLILNPHSRCNCKCAMCDIWKGDGAQEISARDLERQLASIDRLKVQWVVLSGGEPLMHSGLWPLTTMLRERQIRITLLSSGLLLDRHAASIVKHVDDVIVSLDGPASIHNTIRGIPRAFEVMAAGVARIRSLAPDFRIAGRCTVQRSNFSHLTATVDAARNLGLTSISFLAADLESSAFRRPGGWTIEKQNEVGLTSEEVSHLESETEAVIARGECGRFVSESAAKLRKIIHHFRCHCGTAKPIAPICNAPWASAVVEADGAVRPCFFHPPIGHLNSGKPLDEILNGPEALAFRGTLDVATNPVCQKCVCSLNWKAA